jgi:hypothetical protein
MMRVLACVPERGKQQYKYFTVDLTTKRRSFYSSVNNIFNKSHMISDITKLYLSEAHCLPIIMYSVESLSLQNTQISRH